MSRLRWYVVAAGAVAVVLVVAMAAPALRGALLSGGLLGGGPEPSPSTGPSGCPVSQTLVPECGIWWGAAPGVFTGKPAPDSLADFEAKTGRRAGIYHRYHRGDELFPTPEEIRAARDPAGGRVLLLNWKVAWGTTWADVAAGGQDQRIDRLAEHIKRTFPEKFFLAIHHEPENDVNPDPDSGMTAQDYAAMYRHTVQRLREQGVDNAVFVMVYMGFQGWGVKPWFGDLYPGDDVVDWIGFDPYVSADPSAHHHGDFARLVNQTTDEKAWPGFYDWAVEHHPDKPLMLAEWGVFEYPENPGKKAEIFASVERQLPDHPALKALVYFDSPRAPRGDTSVDSSDGALDAFRALAALDLFWVLPGASPNPPSPDPSSPGPTSPSPTSPSPSQPTPSQPTPSQSTPSRSPSPDPPSPTATTATASPPATTPHPSLRS